MVTSPVKLALKLACGWAVLFQQSNQISPETNSLSHSSLSLGELNFGRIKLTSASAGTADLLQGIPLLTRQTSMWAAKTERY